MLERMLRGRGGDGAKKLAMPSVSMHTHVQASLETQLANIINPMLACDKMACTARAETQARNVMNLTFTCTLMVRSRECKIRMVVGTAEATQLTCICDQHAL